MSKRAWYQCSRVALWWIVSSMAATAPAYAQASDIVLYSSDVSVMHGNWSRVSDTGAAGGQEMVSADRGWSAADAPLVSPADYFEATFEAPSATTYKIWLRLRATGNSKWNDAVWVQFSDSTMTGGAAAYRIGTTSGLLVNLARCRDCGMSGWGWRDKGYWTAQASQVIFGGSGQHTLRVQTREDGVQIDQIVLSPSTFDTNAPGQDSGDTTIVPKPPTPWPPSVSTPYSGTPAALPGTIQAEHFDNGGAGVAYHDSSSGNEGGALRSTDVDLEPASGGGHDVGWAIGGEWLQYGVNVASAGAYRVDFRVASSLGGGAFHLEMNGSNVTGTVPMPDTGGWQNWQTLSRTVTLAAGAQTARLVIDSSGGNFDWMAFSSSTSGGSPPATPNSPNVPNGAKGVTLKPTLSWSASGATSYELRLSVANPPQTYAANLSSSWHTTAQLDDNDTFYWQVVATNSAGSSTGPVWSFKTEKSPPHSGHGGDLRMMTWNIHQGRTKSNVYDLIGQVNYIASQHPDVVALQEVNTWDENQPQHIRTLLQNATGDTWTVVWAPVTNSAGTEGNVILSRLPVVSSSTFQMHATSDHSVMLANRSAAIAEIQVGGVNLNVVATHLDYANTTYRTIQLQQLMGWLTNVSGPRLVGGDFNSWWGEQWIATMTSQHTDTWRDVTGSNELGYTVNNAVRFDYIFRGTSGASHVTPINCVAPMTTLSDHNPVIADFTVR